MATIAESPIPSPLADFHIVSTAGDHPARCGKFVLEILNNDLVVSEICAGGYGAGRVGEGYTRGEERFMG